MSSILTIVRQRRRRREGIHTGARKRARGTAMSMGFILSMAGVGLLVAAAVVYALFTQGLPPLERLEVLLDPTEGLLLQPTRLYDRTGQHLLAVLAPENSTRVYVAHDQLPQSLVDATLALTEPGFRNSPGFSFIGWRDPDSHPTLAQQLVFDFLLWDQPATARRAIHERMLAAQVTSQFGREQVLEWIFNSTHYGNGAYGVEAAARLYFAKPAAGLDLSESALLAAVSQAPELDPFTAPGQAEARRVQTLMVMQGMGFLTPEQASLAIAAAPVIAPPPAPAVTDVAPAFTSLVLAQLDGVIGSGWVRRGGMTIRTSLDYDLQLQATCTLKAALAGFSAEDLAAPMAGDGSPCRGASLLPPLQGGEAPVAGSVSAVVLDPQTGQILALVGDLGDGVDGSLLLDHPAGTSITPLIYLAGFTRGLGPASLVWDLPGGEPVTDRTYHGPVRLRTALVNDYLPPVGGIIAQIGVESIRTIAAPFGVELPVDLLARDIYLSPLTLAGAYSVFAASGMQSGQPVANHALGLYTVLKVTGVDHAAWLDWTSPASQSLLSPQLAYLVNHILSDEIARTAVPGKSDLLAIGQPAAVKLSPSLDGEGIWTTGYTPGRVVVVHMAGQVDSVANPITVSRLWHALMIYATQGIPSQGWEQPAGVVGVRVCDPSGLLPTDSCPNVVSEIFLDERQPLQADTFYQSFQVNRETGMLATVFTPPELVESRTYLVLPAIGQEWAAGNDVRQPPASYDTLKQVDHPPEVSITAPGMFTSQRGMVKVLGTAAGEDFVSYRLEYGQGLYPTVWVQIGEDSASPVVDGVLGEWDTSDLEGLYALRLMVVRQEQAVEQALLQVTLDNTPPQVAVTYPGSGQVISLAVEAQVPIRAQVNEPFLERVEFYLNGDLVAVSTQSPFGLIWQAQAGEYTLKTVAVDKAGNTAETSIPFSVR